MVESKHNPERDAPVYNIKAVSRLTGVAADTLRRWESRYHVLEPQRTEGGYRLYSQKDVDTILWLSARLDEGLSIGRACELLRRLGGDPTQTATAARPAPTSRVDGGRTAARSFEALRDALLDAVRAVDEAACSDALTEALSLYTPEEVLLKVVQPALVQIGDDWQSGRVSVAVEHFASAFVRTRLSNIFQSSHLGEYGPLVLVACAPNESHELGTMIFAAFLRRAGFRVVYLGQDVPLESLERMIDEIRPDAVCVSATRPETAAHLTGLRDFLDALRKRDGRSPLLACGGQAFNSDPLLAERLGAIHLGVDAASATRALSERLMAGARRPGAQPDAVAQPGRGRSPA